MTSKFTGPFFHCRKCIEGGARPMDARFEIITNGTHIQVWCVSCDTEVGAFELKHPIPVRCDGGGHD